MGTTLPGNRRRTNRNFLLNRSTLWTLQLLSLHSTSTKIKKTPCLQLDTWMYLEDLSSSKRLQWQVCHLQDKLKIWKEIEGCSSFLSGHKVAPSSYSQLNPKLTCLNFTSSVSAGTSCLSFYIDHLKRWGLPLCSFSDESGHANLSWTFPSLYDLSNSLHENQHFIDYAHVMSFIKISLGPWWVLVNADPARLSTGQGYPQPAPPHSPPGVSRERGTGSDCKLQSRISKKYLQVWVANSI